MTLQPTNTPHPALDFIEITSTGLRVTRKMQFNEFQFAYQTYSDVEESIQVLIADLLVAGEKQFGESYAQVVKATGRKTKTIQNWVYIVKAVPYPRRREGLSTISHLAEFASAPPAMQIALMDWAEKETADTGLPTTAREIRKERQKRMGIAPLGISLDQATKKTGLCTWKDGFFENWYLIYADDWRDMFAQIIKGFSDISSVPPAWVAVEPTYGGPADKIIDGKLVKRSNPQTIKKLNRLAGAIIGWCDLNGIPVYTCQSVSQIDKACGVRVGLARAQRKKAVESMMIPLIGKHKGGAAFDEDVYDAALMGLWALGEIKIEKWSEQDDQET